MRDDALPACISFDEGNNISAFAVCVVSRPVQRLGCPSMDVQLLHSRAFCRSSSTSFAEKAKRRTTVSPTMRRTDAKT